MEFELDAAGRIRPKEFIDESMRRVKMNLHPVECPDCWNTGYFHGMGGPCTRAGCGAKRT